MNVSISADSVAYLNGNIYTVDKSRPWAEAFIVTPDAKFAAIGSTIDIAQQAKSAHLITVDLKGSFVMPGIHDSHVHTFHSGLHLLSDINMDYSTNSSNLQPRMQEGFGACAFHNTYADWIVGVLNEIEDYDRELIDQDWPNNPVIIHAVGGHLKYLNTLGLERAGFDIMSEPDADRRDFLRKPDGSLSGAVGGQSAMGQANMAVTRPTVTHVKRALKRASMELHRNGVTSVQEAASGRLFLEALQSLDKEGQLKMEYATHILYRNEWLTGELRENGEEIVSMAREYASKHVDTRFVKIMMDGNPIVPSPTVSHLDERGEIDMKHILEKNLGPNLEKWDAAGLTCKIHAAGSGAVRQALNNFATLREGNPGGPRHEIAHCVSVDKADIPRFREFNITAEMSPAMHFKTDFPPPNLGFNFPALLAAETLVTVGSDWAFGMSLPLFPSVAHLVDQVGADRVIEMMTINGVKSVGKDMEYGTIAVGKTANFIAVDRDLMKEGFENATVTKTWFEGELVFDVTGDQV